MHLNDLLYLLFKLRKWVLDSRKIEWYCGIKSFLSLSINKFFIISPLFNDFKVLTRFPTISFLSFIFWYVFRITFTSNKVYYFSQANVLITCRPCKIYLHSERKACFFFLPKTFDFLFQKRSNIYWGKRVVL